jgi:hypothetical protein
MTDELLTVYCALITYWRKNAIGVSKSGDLVNIVIEFGIHTKLLRLIAASVV